MSLTRRLPGFQSLSTVGIHPDGAGGNGNPLWISKSCCSSILLQIIFKSTGVLFHFGPIIISSENLDLNKAKMSAQSHTELYYHFTWSTKLRKKIILPAWEDRLYGFIRFKCKEIDLQVIALNGVEEHMHLLVRAQADQSPAMIAHDAKGASSHFVNSEALTPKRFSWQNGYGAFSVSPHYVAKVKRYIGRQKEHHGRGTAISEWEEDGGDSGKSE